MPQRFFSGEELVSNCVEKLGDNPMVYLTNAEVKDGGMLLTYECRKNHAT